MVILTLSQRSVLRFPECDVFMITMGSSVCVLIRRLLPVLEVGLLDTSTNSSTSSTTTSSSNGSSISSNYSSS
jgi:hypothetical protein